MRAISFILLSGFLASTLVGCADSENTSSTEDQPVTVEVQNEPKEDYLALGKEIAQGTFKALSGKLKSQIMEGGVEQALPFCNANAMPLTDSLSIAYDAKIQRVALDYRNPKNMALDYDVDVFMEYETLMSNGKMVKPQLHTNDDGKTVFYGPIILKSQCIVCHGKPIEDITEGTLTKINALYPDDNATGFAEGDLRALWKITFNN